MSRGSRAGSRCGHDLPHDELDLGYRLVAAELG